MNFLRTRSCKALSLVEVLVVIFLISTSLLMMIRLFPNIFMLNKKTEDLITARNLTEELFQTLRGEANSDEDSNITYYENHNVIANNLVNSSKCFWKLVTLTADPNYATYGVLGATSQGNCLDTLLNPTSNSNADTLYTAINPSSNDPNTGKWVATKTFWINWRNRIETQLPTNSSTSSERASAIVTVRYVYLDPVTNVIKVALNDYSSFDDLKNGPKGVNVSGGPLPSLSTSKFMVEVNVSLYWKNRLDKGTYTRDPIKPNYRLSTLITPPLDTALQQSTTPTPAPTPTP